MILATMASAVSHPLALHTFTRPAESYLDKKISGMATRCTGQES